MAHGCFGPGIPQIVANGVAADCLKGCSGNKLMSICCHHDLNRRTSFYESAHKDRGLIGGDSTADTQQNMLS